MWRALLIAWFVLSSGCCSIGLGRLEPFSPAEYATHVRARQSDFGPSFAVIAVPPFVVIGDGPRAWVKQDADEVVSVASRLLKARFFRRDPAVIIDILMLQTDTSYDAYAGSFVGAPATPYGYYSPCRRAIYANMSLGNGTLVHEMVHAFMEANFPASPVWFNEGLGSLYEHTDLSGRKAPRPFYHECKIKGKFMHPAPLSGTALRTSTTMLQSSNSSPMLVARLDVINRSFVTNL